MSTKHSFKVGQIVFTRDEKRTIEGMVVALVGEKIFCDWPSVGVYSSQENPERLEIR